MSETQRERKLVVMISSTARDLPEHREQAEDACHRLGMFPKMMEHLPPTSDAAIAASRKMIDEADIYLAIVAYKYGSRPDGHDRSFTEIEYDHAVKRGIPRVVLLMSEQHPLTAGDVEKGEGGVKVDAFRARLQNDQVVNFFNSPDGLRADAIHGLGEARQRLDEEAARAAEAAGAAVPQPKGASLHHVSDIPAPPEPWIAHPYTLLQTKGLIGRQRELGLLTDWVTGKGTLGDARILTVVAIGGMGKSALTWKWFNDIAPQEMAPRGLAGRAWWSFYESDATFDNFVARTLAYVSRRSEKQVREEHPAAPDREAALLATLDREPFLVVLDGFERILAAYARMDAAYLRDAEMDDETANRVAGAVGLPSSACQSYVGRHALRRTADPHVGHFLKQLARVRASRILVSSRLYPADLQAVSGGPLPGCGAVFLPGLRDEDALDLWRAFGARGSREAMLPVFATFERHPLLIQLLAGEVADFHEAPGDFDAWRKARPDFNPFGMALVNVQSHVLDHAMRVLGEAQRRTLHVIAGFRLPAGMDTLTALLVRQPGAAVETSWVPPFATVVELDAALTVLEDRGLIGWDRAANRHDLHPIVRGVAWNRLDEASRQGIHGALHDHFQAIPEISDWRAVESLDDLAPAIELYHALIGLRRFDDAFVVFRDRLDNATHHRLRASRQRGELLERLFPDGLDRLPRLRTPWDHGFALNGLAQTRQFTGRFGEAVALFRRAAEIVRRDKDEHNLAVCLYNVSQAMHFAGALSPAEAAVRAALVISRKVVFHLNEGVSLYVLGQTLAARGDTEDAMSAFHRSQRIWRQQHDLQGDSLVSGHLADAMVHSGDSAAAKAFANRAWDLAAIGRHEHDFIRAARVQGTAALGLGDFPTADERLHHALTRARACDLVEEELPTLVALARLHVARGEPARARELLDDMWEPAERGPYPLFHADARNVLAQIERDAGNRDRAVAAATRAFELSWCDGPPFAYHWGLVAARAHLAALGATEPTLPPYDESRFEPMPDVEINPHDEFFADEP